MDRSAELVRQDHIQEAMRVCSQWKCFCVCSICDYKRAREAVNKMKGSLALTSSLFNQNYLIFLKYFAKILILGGDSLLCRKKGRIMSP